MVLRREDIEALPDLRYIGVTATGTNVVDFEACRARKHRGDQRARVFHQLGRTVRHRIALALRRRLSPYVTRVKQNAWAEAPDFCFLLHPHIELAERTMAIFGSGSIGRKVADAARGAWE